MYSGLNYSKPLIYVKKENIALAALRLMRPEQWIKNSFVFLGLLFSDHSLQASSLINSMIAFILFCGMSSSVYIVNDIVDIEKDKIHPRKKLRPLPSGAITIRHAIAFGIMVFCTTLIGAFLFNYVFCLIAFLYFTLNLIYSFKLKNLIILDILTISLGFLLRVISGSIAIQEEISYWSLICTLFLTLFLGLNKRKQEISTLSQKAVEHRKNLNEYSIELINQLLPIVTSCTVLSYSLYTFQGTRTKWLMVTIPFAIYAVMRYQYLTYKTSIGENPETVLIKDLPFVTCFVSWGGVFISLIAFV